MQDESFTIDVIEKDGKYFAKWSFQPDNFYHDVEEVKTDNYHHYVDCLPSSYIVFGGWAFWLLDELGTGDHRAGMLKTAVACPDCGSHNIEVVDGPIMQCEANHSGECQDCFTAWTID